MLTFLNIVIGLCVAYFIALPFLFIWSATLDEKEQDKK